MNKNRKKNRETESTAEAKLKGFLDMIAPSVIQFYTDHYICGNTYRSVWALREYPTATDEQAILRHLGEKDGVTLRIYTRQVTPAEEKKIISNAANKNRMKQGNTENLQETVTAASNLQDVTTIISTMHRNREPLLHTAVFLELSAPDIIPMCIWWYIPRTHPKAILQKKGLKPCGLHLHMIFSVRIL